jgi:isopenicillin-N epimerase
MESEQEAALRLRARWRLEPGMTFLNHGSFGASPLAVMEAQRALQEQMERQPLRFFLREYGQLLDNARVVLARFVGADPEGLVFVNNATQGVGAAVRSAGLQAGDEVLILDHAYNACRNLVLEEAARAGARVVVASIPAPLLDPGVAVEAVLGAVTARTKLALLDHITSPTALVLPVEALVPALEARGVATVVDGAHAPGQVALSLEALGASWYVANCHKWLCAPKGAAFVSVRADRRAQTRPLSIGHGATAAGRSRLWNEFDWIGTQDYSAWLCVPAAIAHVEGLVEGGWPAIMARNRALARRAAQKLEAALGCACLSGPQTAGSMATLPLPLAPLEPATRLLQTEGLQDRLWERHRVEVPVFRWNGARYLRVSLHVYNHEGEIDALIAALEAELER